MVAVKSLAIVAFAAVVAGQAGNQISDGQIQIQTSPIKLSTPVPSITPVSVTPVPVTPVSVTPASVTPVASVTPKTTLSSSTRASASATIRPSANGTFTGAPAPTVTPFKGAANVIAWGKEIAIGAVGIALGLAIL